MPKFAVSIDLEGVWYDEVLAGSVEEAAKIALTLFEETDAESICACLDNKHPIVDDVDVEMLPS